MLEFVYGDTPNFIKCPIETGNKKLNDDRQEFSNFETSAEEDLIL